MGHVALPAEAHPRGMLDKACYPRAIPADWVQRQGASVDQNAPVEHQHVGAETVPIEIERVAAHVSGWKNGLRKVVKRVVRRLTSQASSSRSLRQARRAAQALTPNSEPAHRRARCARDKRSQLRRHE